MMDTANNTWQALSLPPPEEQVCANCKHYRPQPSVYTSCMACVNKGTSCLNNADWIDRNRPIPRPHPNRWEYDDSK